MRGWRREPSGDSAATPLGATVDADPVLDPEAGRNADQHRALRDD